MSDQRHLPHRANLAQLRSQAKELLREFRKGEARAIQLFKTFQPDFEGPAKLSDAQLVIARQYGQKNWHHLIQAVEALPLFRELLDCFKQNKLKEAEEIVKSNPVLLERKDLLGRSVRHGSLEMVRLMYDLGARNVQEALGYIVYGDKRAIAQFLLSKGATLHEPDAYRSVLLGACEVLNAAAFEICLKYMERNIDPETARNCLAMVLSTYSRNPIAKHKILKQLAIRHFELPDTPVMALHAGRLDRLSNHLAKDPHLFERRFEEAEVYPLTLGIKPGDGLHLAPLQQTSLLHLAIEFDEREILRWLLEQGVDPNLQTGIDAEGFGGHTALFHATVSYTWQDSEKARWLLEAGADPNRRATIRKQLRYMGQRHLERMYEFNNVTCIGFARQFKVSAWVSEPSIRCIKDFGGEE